MGGSGGVVLEAVYGDDGAGGWASCGGGKLLELALEVVGVVGRGC